MKNGTEKKEKPLVFFYELIKGRLILYKRDQDLGYIDFCCDIGFAKHDGTAKIKECINDYLTDDGRGEKLPSSVIPGYVAYEITSKKPTIKYKV